MMVEWKVVEVETHRDVGDKIAEMKQEGWDFHSYHTSSSGNFMWVSVNHYILFAKQRGSS